MAILAVLDGPYGFSLNIILMGARFLLAVGVGDAITPGPTNTVPPSISPLRLSQSRRVNTFVISFSLNV